jgi:4-hydroxyphenylpyruvate dioxygenase
MSTITNRNQHQSSIDSHMVLDFDYIDLYVGNTYQAAHFYRTAMGFQPLAYCGLETGLRDGAAVVMQQEKVRFVLSSALGPDGVIAEHFKRHGDGVKDVAFTVRDVRETFAHVVERGAWPVMEPTVLEDERGQVTKAVVKGCGNLVHSLIQRNDYGGAFLPNFKPFPASLPGPSTAISAIDHIAFGVEPGTLNLWADFYTRVFDFEITHEDNVSTEYSGMNSKVVQSKNGRIKFPIVEPAQGKRKSQVMEYLDFYQGPGVQHAALLTHDIIETVRTLSANGIEFLSAPGSYYDTLSERIGSFDEEPSVLKELSILLDREANGYLMQIFSKPLQTRPTFFVEMIQRKGARGFGGGNIKALFEAVEREQAQRGNLQ